MKFSAEIKAKWLEALRSGTYPQGKDYLYKSDPERYCCLGVLCKTQDIEIGSTVGFVAVRNAYQDLKMVFGGKIFDSLVDMNDDGKTFAEIADWIEANVDI